MLQVNKMMRDMYGDDFMVLVLSLPESNIVKTRKTRSLLATDEVSPPIKILTCFTCTT